MTQHERLTGAVLFTGMAGAVILIALYPLTMAVVLALCCIIAVALAAVELKHIAREADE